MRRIVIGAALAFACGMAHAQVQGWPLAKALERILRYQGSHPVEITALGQPELGKPFNRYQASGLFTFAVLPGVQASGIATASWRANLAANNVPPGTADARSLPMLVFGPGATVLAASEIDVPPWGEVPPSWPDTPSHGLAVVMWPVPGIANLREEGALYGWNSDATTYPAATVRFSRTCKWGLFPDTLRGGGTAQLQIACGSYRLDTPTLWVEMSWQSVFVWRIDGAGDVKPLQYTVRYFSLSPDASVAPEAAAQSQYDVRFE